MTVYLTVEQVLFIHARLITETGGAHGVLNLSLLISAVARPQATFEGHDLYSDLFFKTAALLESLVGNHPFLDGNKRTAITAAGLFLKINGLSLMVSNDELASFVMSCVQGWVNLEQIAAWLKKAIQIRMKTKVGSLIWRKII